MRAAASSWGTYWPGCSARGCSPGAGACGGRGGSSPWCGELMPQIVPCRGARKVTGHAAPPPPGSQRAGHRTGHREAGTAATAPGAAVAPLPGGRPVAEALTQLCTPPVDARADRAELDAEGLGDLLVGQPLDVGENDGRPVLRLQLVERLLDVGVEEVVDVDVLRRGGPAVQQRRELVGEGVEAQPLLAPGAVQEEVRRDPVQPPLEGAGGVAVEGAEDPHEGVVGQVLRLVDISGEPVGEAVDALTVLLDDLAP